MAYENETLATQVVCHNEQLNLLLLCTDIVDFHENIFMRKITIRDTGRMSQKARDMRLFFSHDFHINGHEIGDTAYYEPERKVVFHYKGNRWFCINGACQADSGFNYGIDQWSVGIKETGTKEGTWRDAEDGVLSLNPVAQGSVDSTIGLHAKIEPDKDTVVWYWIAVAENFEEVTRLNRLVRERTPLFFLDRTEHYWALWVKKSREDLPCLSDKLKQLYNRSLFILRAHVDNGGAIVAANDFDIINFARDTYSYMWGRDGAIAAYAFTKAGYTEVPRRFFTFCHSVITKEGYLLHKYNPDRSLASSWHGWYYERKKVLPVQEDETALVIWALWKYFEQFHEVEFVKPLYRGLIIRAGNWLSSYIDEGTGLPQPGWDLWEERYGVFSWTCGAVWAALQGAANFADAFGEHNIAAHYRSSASTIRSAVESNLWDSENGCYANGLIHGNGSPQMDTVPNSSVAGLWYFGLLPVDDPRVVSTMNHIHDRLWLSGYTGGMARYEHDNYQRAVDNKDIPGNPWFVTTLWLAQWHIASAKTEEMLWKASELLEWVASHALPSGVMAEQIHPLTNAPLSVSPLAWSHAALVCAVHEYYEKWKQVRV